LSLFYFIFYQKKKKVLKNGSGSGRVAGQVGLTRKKHRLGHGSTRFCFGQKIELGQVFFRLGRVRLENFDLFCHVYL